ncbi:MAG: pitrilysin family protein [Alphaproteobacteria bacterium]|nr:pitrilysin family protein [Alphaproteobacteria bacterium]
MKLKPLQFGVLGFCMGILALSYPAQAQFQKVFGAKTATLANGMQVVVIENHRAPVVTHMVWYQVGSADEPKGDGVSGAAHFLEHLMFKGSGAIAPGEFSKLIRNVGGNDNAFTSWDYTAFFQTVPSKYLPQVMALEADRMINLSLADRDIESERDVIIEERRMRTDNDPQSLFMEQMRAALFPNSAYAEPIIGWRDEMPLLGRQDVMEYYKAWYTPANAILVVSGDVNFEEVVSEAEKAYGVIPSHPYPEHIRSKSPDFRAETRLTLHDEDVRQPTLYKAWLVPAFLEDKHTYYSFEVMAEAISGNASTKLYQTLVVNRKKATSISLSYDGEARGQGSLWLYAIPAPGVSIEDLEKEINTAFREIVGNGIEEQDVERAKTRLIDQALFARDSVAGPAMVIGQALALGATLDDVENWPQKIDSITREDVQTIFDMYMNPEAPKRLPVTGILLPAEDKAK